MPRQSSSPSRDPLAAAQRAFARWRGAGRAGRQIPATLWDLAVAATRTHGVSRTAQALGLNWGRLQAQLRGDPPPPPRRRRTRTAAPPAPPAPFVELPSLPLAPPPACRVEVQDPRGRRVSVELAAAALPQLPAVLRGLGLARA